MSFMKSIRKRKRDFMNNNNNNNIKFNSISLEKRIQENIQRNIQEIKENNRHFNHSPTSAFIDVAQSKGRKSPFLENGDYIGNNKNKF